MAPNGDGDDQHNRSRHLIIALHYGIGLLIHRRHSIMDPNGFAENL